MCRRIAEDEPRTNDDWKIEAERVLNAAMLAGYPALCIQDGEWQYGRLDAVAVADCEGWRVFIQMMGPGQYRDAVRKLLLVRTGQEPVDARVNR